MPESDRTETILEAVRRGEVKHIHPFTWVVPLSLIDMRGVTRSLDGLARRGVIRVDASSKEHHRPVCVTEEVKDAKK